MKIKILFSLFVVLFMLSAAMPLLAAEEKPDGSLDIQKLVEEKAAIVKPGILPTSFWYWADIYGEQIGYLFTFTKEKKIDYLIGEAGERLAEKKKLTDEGITKYVEDLLRRHDGEVKLATQILQQIKEESVAKALETQADLEKRILIEQSDLANKAKAAPAEYDKGVSSAAGKVGAWLKDVVNHLAWKRGEINKQKAELSE